MSGSGFAGEARDGVGSPARGPRETVSAGWLAVVLAALIVELTLLLVWQRNSYWDFSDGVYAMSARELLHGLVPYRDFAAAQPPPVYLVGVLLLAIHDGLYSLRVGLSLVELLTAVLVGVSVWRLIANRWLAAVAALATPLLPISLHEHAQLIPETIAAPLLLGGAICCSRSRQATVGGALVALAAACKVAFAIPALAIVLASVARRRAISSFLIIGLLLGAASLAGFGGAEWRQVIEAQFQVGTASLHTVAGLLAQAVWSEFPLVLGAAFAVWLTLTDAPEVLDQPLARTLAAGATAGLILALTVFKVGSYISVLVVAEPPLLALAVCGAAWAWRRSRPLVRAFVAALAVLLVAESLSIITDPSAPWAAKRPGAASGLAWSAGQGAISRETAIARDCPPSDAYSGDPYVAFLAGRRMPGQQPDLFMLQHARADAAFARRAALDRARCPSV